MIVSASYKTDIPALYGRWFRARLAAGSCRMRNPYGGQVYDLPLTPGSVDGFVFWTRNAVPFSDALDEVAARGFPFTVQYSITGYGRRLEPSVPRTEAMIEAVRALARRWGPRAVVWRYDPVLISSDTPVSFHAGNFAAIARALGGASDEVVVSFAHVYRKTARNLDALKDGFSWIDPLLADKTDLVARLAVLAGDYGLRLTVCSQADIVAVAHGPARCIDADRLSDVAGRAITAPVKGNRPGCLCHAARDIGDYDTCPHGCAYCYAVSNRARGRAGHARHDPTAAALVPPAPVAAAH